MLKLIIVIPLAFLAGYALHVALLVRFLRKAGYQTLEQMETSVNELSEACGTLLEERWAYCDTTGDDGKRCVH